MTRGRMAAARAAATGGAPLRGAPSACGFGSGGGVKAASGALCAGRGPSAMTSLSFSPARLASFSRAPPKLTLSCLVTKPITSPAAPQPKQWKRPLLGETLKEAVFSWWKGQEATSCRPFRLSSMPRSATTAWRSFAPLMRSMPAFVTCIAPLLLSYGLEGRVLQAAHLGLEAPKVDERLAAVVVALRVRHAFPDDPE